MPSKNFKKSDAICVFSKSAPKIGDAVFAEVVEFVKKNSFYYSDEADVKILIESDAIYFGDTIENVKIMFSKLPKMLDALMVVPVVENKKEEKREEKIIETESVLVQNERDLIKMLFAVRDSYLDSFEDFLDDKENLLTQEFNSFQALLNEFDDQSLDSQKKHKLVVKALESSKRIDAVFDEQPSMSQKVLIAKMELFLHSLGERLDGCTVEIVSKKVRSGEDAVNRYYLTKDQFGTWSLCYLTIKDSNTISIKEVPTLEEALVRVGNKDIVQLSDGEKAGLKKIIMAYHATRPESQVDGVCSGYTYMLVKNALIDKQNSLLVGDASSISAAEKFLTRKKWLITLKDNDMQYGAKLYKEYQYGPQEEKSPSKWGQSDRENWQKKLGKQDRDLFEKFADCYVFIHELLFAQDPRHTHLRVGGKRIQQTDYAKIMRFLQPEALRDVSIELENGFVFNFINTGEISEVVMDLIMEDEEWSVGNYAHAISVSKEKTRNQYEYIVRDSNSRGKFAVYEDNDMGRVKLAEKIKKCLFTNFKYDSAVMDISFGYYESKDASKKMRRSMPKTMIEKVLRSRKNSEAINLRSSKGETALMLASEKGYTTEVAALVEQKGIDPNIHDVSNQIGTALHTAVVNSDLNTVQALLEHKYEDGKGIDPNIHPLSEGSALRVAVNNQDIEIVRALLKTEYEHGKGIDPSIGYLTALETAVDLRAYTIVELLLTKRYEVGKGINPNKAFMSAVSARDIRLAQMLMKANYEKGKEINPNSVSYGGVLLCTATSNQDHAMMQFLLEAKYENGQRINHALREYGGYGHTPFEIAVDNLDYAAIKILQAVKYEKNMGIDPNDGCKIAIRKNSSEMLSLLLDAKYENCTPPSPNALLEYAIKVHKNDMLKFLLDKYADTNIIDFKKAFECAVQEKQIEAIKIIVSHPKVNNINLDYSDLAHGYARKTALDLAIEIDDIETIRIILSRKTTNLSCGNAFQSAIDKSRQGALQAFSELRPSVPHEYIKNIINLKNLKASHLYALLRDPGKVPQIICILKFLKDMDKEIISCLAKYFKDDIYDAITKLADPALKLEALDACCGWNSTLGDIFHTKRHFGGGQPNEHRGLLKKAYELKKQLKESGRNESKLEEKNSSLDDAFEVIDWTTEKPSDQAPRASEIKHEKT